MTFIDIQSIDVASLLQAALVPVFLLWGAALTLGVLNERLTSAPRLCWSLARCYVFSQRCSTFSSNVGAPRAR